MASFSLIELGIVGCSARGIAADTTTNSSDSNSSSMATNNSQEGGGEVNANGTDTVDTSFWTLDESSQTDRGFTVDNVLHVANASLLPGGGEVHFSIHVPDTYDGSTSCALYVALPGWEGLLFQGVGANLQEDFPFVANNYVADMIVATPQLDDWGDTSARKTIALTEWLLSNYNIDTSRVVLSGCSGGGETASLVMGMKPALFAACLHTISRWDGDLNVLAQAKVPLYMAIGVSDDYYGPDYDRATYQQLHDIYAQQGLTEDEIAQLVVLDVKPTSYFGYTGERFGQHAGGGALFPHDEKIMGWFFGHVQKG